jgi:hypothetical protein
MAFFLLKKMRSGFDIANHYQKKGLKMAKNV